MVFLIGLIVLQVIRPLPGPEGSPLMNGSTSNSPPLLVPSTNGNNSYNNIVPNKATYGGDATITNTPPRLQPPLSGTFHPSMAIIIGVLSTMFSFTFLILLYAKHCKLRPSVNAFGAPTLNHDVVNPTPLAHFGPAGLLFADRDSGLDRAIIEALPMFSFSALKGMKEGLECSVCLSRYENPEILRLLPKCKHAFHLDCVDVWLSSHSTCPLCRVRVDAQDTLVVEDFSSMFNKPGSEPASFRRQSARISLSELADNYLDHAFEFYVQREAENADVLTGSLRPQQHGSGRAGSWRKDGTSISDRKLGSERKLGSWRNPANFSGPFGASERKELGSSARIVPLQVIASEVHGSLRRGSDAAAGSAPLNLQAAAGNDHYFYDEQLARRLGHRIIVSDVMLHHRWSDFLPSDVPFFDANTVPLRERSGPVSGELSIKAAGQETCIKEIDAEMGLEKTTSGDKSARMSSARVADADQALEAEKQKSAEKQKKQAGNQRGLVRVGGSRLRCMSELSGLQRVQQGAAGKQLFQAAAADDNEIMAPADESTRRWFVTARRTLKWFLGSGTPRPAASSSPAGPIQP